MTAAKLLRRVLVIAGAFIAILPSLWSSGMFGDLPALPFAGLVQIIGLVLMVIGMSLTLSGRSRPRKRP